MINITEINQAVATLRAGGLVAFPTETVYGLGADAKNVEAVRQVFLAKRRPADHPLIVHIESSKELKDWAEHIPPAALILAEAFWPGPLTMVFAKQAHVLDEVTAGQPTVALRVPNHPVALSLLKAFGGGLVAPSANQFTHISPTTAEAVHEELAGAVDMILDGGACQVGVESTIVDMSGDLPVILRPGMISSADIACVLDMTVLTAQQVNSKMRVPGQHLVHYAPTTKTRMMSQEALLAYIENTESTFAVMAYSNALLALDDPRVHAMPVNAKAYAHDLYHTLRALDHLDVQEIVLEAVPLASEWDAIRDRLTKASGE